MQFQHTITDLPEENEYPKLIRDLIPEIIKKHSGKDAHVRRLDDDEFEEYLRKKVVEEAIELRHADSEHNLAEEIADVQELLDTLLKFKGISKEQINTVQDQKRTERGGFEKRLLMENND